MKVSTEQIKELREQSGAGVMDCRNALVEAEGHLAKAMEILKERSLLKVEKKKSRAATKGIVDAYIHATGRIGAMVEINCETDFAANTSQIKELAHNVAMQVAAMAPLYVSAEDIPQGADVEPAKVALLLQPYIRNLDMTIQDLVNETIARIGENVKVGRFARFELGE